MKGKGGLFLSPIIPPARRRKEIEAVKHRLFWFYRSLLCLLKGHDDGAAFFNPITGDRDLGFICFRCGRPKLTGWAATTRNNKR